MNEEFIFTIIPEYSEKTARWQVAVDLSGTRYKLQVSYNSTAGGWYLNICDLDENLICGGIRLSVGSDLLSIRLSVGSDLLKKYHVICPKLPKGELWLLDVTNDYKTAELERFNFSTRFKFCYGEV